MTDSADIIGAEPGGTSGSLGTSSDGGNSLDLAALATLEARGVSCSSDQLCLAAVQSACAIMAMGYTSDDVYTEMYLFPEDRILPDFPNSAVPHFFGVANGGYCDNY